MLIEVEPEKQRTGCKGKKMFEDLLIWPIHACNLVIGLHAWNKQ